jgi:hypothetical protein
MGETVRVLEPVTDTPHRAGAACCTDGASIRRAREPRAAYRGVPFSTTHPVSSVPGLDMPVLPGTAWLNEQGRHREQPVPRAEPER